MSGGHRGVAWTMVGSATLNIILSVILIPMLGLAGAALATLISALTLEFGVMLKRTCNHQAVKLASVLRPLIPVLLSLVPMFLTAHWLNLYWPVSSLLALAVQCVVAGVIFLAVACMVVIRSDERRRVIGRITDWNSQRRLKHIPAPARQD